MKWMPKRFAAAVCLSVIFGLAMGYACVALGANASTGTSLRRNLTKVNRTKINITGSGELIAAVAGQRIQVWGILYIPDSATTSDFFSGSNSLTSPCQIAAILEDVPASDNQNADSAFPLFETNVGENFNVVLGTSVHIGGQLIWTTAP